MTENSVAAQQDAKAGPRWQPLGSIDRRVIGVLAEKAKTTPDAYPLSLNAACAGCNQKSNREPLMNLSPDDVEQSLDRLRDLGAVGIVQGYGRVSKYRHYLYEWLGVDKFEMAVMTELLLRGAQTEGELRGRASRMEPIAGLAELRPILDSLRSKGLVISLTPEGRGHVVSHALYQPGELEKLRAQYGPSGRHQEVSPPAAVSKAESAKTFHDEFAALGAEVARLREDVDALKDQLRRFKDELGA